MKPIREEYIKLDKAREEYLCEQREQFAIKL